MKPWRKDVSDDMDQAIEAVTWRKTPAPPLTAPGAAPGQHPARDAAPAPAPAPGHRRGDHMVIDVWACGCIHTWTRKTGWEQDTSCIDEEIRKLTAP